MLGCYVWRSRARKNREMGCVSGKDVHAMTKTRRTQRQQKTQHRMTPPAGPMLPNWFICSSTPGGPELGNPPGPSFFSPSGSMVPYRSARPARTRTIRRNELVRAERQLFSGFSATATQISGCRKAELPQKHLCQVRPGKCALVDEASLPFHLRMPSAHGSFHVWHAC